MQRDCNTCEHHRQGTHPSTVLLAPETTCLDCLESETFKLPMYRPKEAVKMNAEKRAVSAVLEQTRGIDVCDAIAVSRITGTGEKDPSGLDAKAPGAKLDAGKPDVIAGLLETFPSACEEVAGLTHHGAEKYSWGGWAHVKNGRKRYRAAIGRHITKEAIEGPWDSDWTKHGKNVRHATAVAWNALAALELTLREERQAKEQHQCTHTPQRS